MKNIEELRNNLSTLFEQIKTGQMDVKAAAEMNNTAGKIISTLKVQLDYAALRKEAPQIGYLDVQTEDSK